MESKKILEAIGAEEDFDKDLPGSKCFGCFRCLRMIRRTSCHSIHDLIAFFALITKAASAELSLCYYDAATRPVQLLQALFRPYCTSANGRRQ